MIKLLAMFLLLSWSPPGATIQEEDCSEEKEEIYLQTLADTEAGQSDDRLVEAMVCLGRLKSIPAVLALKDRLTDRRTFDWEVNGRHDRVVGLLGRYPAAGALVKIGKPALPPVQALIARHPEDSLEWELAVWIVLSIFQFDKENAQVYLRKASLATTSERQRESLLAAVDELQQWGSRSK